MNRKLLQQCLDALKSAANNECNFFFYKIAANAIQKELIKPEQEPVAYWNGKDGFICADDAQYIPNWSDYYPKPLYTSSFVFADNSAKTVDHGFNRTASHMAGEYVDTKQENVDTFGQCTHKSDKSIHEPVAWLYHGHLHELDPSDWAEYEVTPLYKAPQSKEWVGLTSEEIENIVNMNTSDDSGYDIWCDGKSVAQEVEAKLRAKNETS